MANFMIIVVLEWNMARGLKSGGGSGNSGIGRSGGKREEGRSSYVAFCPQRNWSLPQR